MEKGCKAGVIKIKDLINLENRFMSYNEFLQRYGNVLNFLEFQGIISAIPLNWKHIVICDINVENRIYNFYYDEMAKVKKVSTKAYNTLITNEENVVYAMWDVKFNCNINNEEFLSLFRLIDSITSHTKLRSFQFRLLHYYLVTNKDLF